MQGKQGDEKGDGVMLDTYTEVQDEDLEVHLFPKGDPEQAELNPEHIRLMKEFGLHRNRQLLERQSKHIPYAELTGYELHVTMAFLPTCYPEDRWEFYDFDIVPLHVLKALEAAKESISQFEIWTPEAPRDIPRGMMDPMLVGVVGDLRRAFPGGRINRNRTFEYRTDFDRNARFFPIARWGEAVKTFRDMEQTVLKKAKSRMNGKCCNVRRAFISPGFGFCLQCADVRNY